jgi:hypothetical protein
MEDNFCLCVMTLGVEFLPSDPPPNFSKFRCVNAFGEPVILTPQSDSVNPRYSGTANV